MSITILSVCPDINNTTIAISKDEDVVYQTDIDHSNSDFLRFKNIMDQLPFRRDAVINQMMTDGINIKDIQFVVAEGGLLKPCKSGVYNVDKTMVADLIDGIGGDDIINMGGLLAFTIANTLRIKSLVVDPASVDERSELAAFTPHSSLRKKSLFHALIHKYLAKKYAESKNKHYNELNIIFCHVSNKSVSVAAHKKGAVVDVNQAYMGYGPMGLCEIGTLPASNIIDMLFVKHYSKEEMVDLIKSNALTSFLGKNPIDEIVNDFKDNKKTKLILEVMAYQISKEIASHYVSLDGEIDAIILSGKIFKINRFFKYIYQRIGKLAPISVFFDDYRIEAMIFNVLEKVKSKESFLSYD